MRGYVIIKKKKKKKKVEVFAAEDVIDTLCMQRKLPRGFLRGPTPYLVPQIGAFKEAHYALVDIGSQVNIISEHLAGQLNILVESGSPVELHNASGTAISVVGVCREVDISTIGRRNLQTFLVTSTNAMIFCSAVVYVSRHKNGCYRQGSFSSGSYYHCWRKRVRNVSKSHLFR